MMVVRHWALLIQTTFSDLDYTSGTQQYETVLTENFMFLSDSVEILYDCWLCQIDQEDIISLFLNFISEHVPVRELKYSLFEKNF